MASRKYESNNRTLTLVGFRVQSKVYFALNQIGIGVKPKAPSPFAVCTAQTIFDDECGRLLSNVHLPDAFRRGEERHLNVAGDRRRFEIEHYVGHLGFDLIEIAVLLFGLQIDEGHRGVFSTGNDLLASGWRAIEPIEISREREPCVCGMRRRRACRRTLTWAR